MLDKPRPGRPTGRHSAHAHCSPGGFTLIEVLVVVAIIALLVAILLPALRRAREESKTVVCIAQIQQLMKASLLYKTDYHDRLPGTGINDARHASAYNAGTRRDWLSWFGTWTVSFGMDQRATNPAWKNAPQGGRLWRYYRDPDVLKCPSSVNGNGKLSYSTPENVSMAMKDPTHDRDGLPPVMDKVKHPAAAIMFLDEDEYLSIASSSLDDGFGEPDVFADRHLGKATVAFFDGHGEAHYFPRGNRNASGFPKVRYSQNRSKDEFRAWMIQIAPFNSRYTPLPWKIKDRKQMPKYLCTANYPGGGQHADGPGCEY